MKTKKRILAMLLAVVLCFSCLHFSVSADEVSSEPPTEITIGTQPEDVYKRQALSQVGQVGGYPYWSWYGFSSRVEWCACFVSWCYGQMGLSEPRFSACQSQGIPWFQSHGQWGGPDYANIAPGDAIFFDWDLDGRADHVGIVVDVYKRQALLHAGDV